MRSKSSLTGALAIVAIYIILFICSRHHVTGAADEIRNFHEFLENSLGGKVLEFNMSNLLKPGDGYKSEIQALEVKLNENNSSNEVKKTHFFSLRLEKYLYLFLFVLSHTV